MSVSVNAELSTAVAAALAKTAAAQAAVLELARTVHAHVGVASRPPIVPAQITQASAAGSSAGLAAHLERLTAISAQLGACASSQRPAAAAPPQRRSLEGGADGPPLRIAVPDAGVDASTLPGRAEAEDPAASRAAAALLSPRSRAFDEARRAAARIHVFADDGAPLPMLPLAELGLSSGSRAAAIDATSHTLYLGDDAGLEEGGGGGCLTSVDLVTGCPLWVTPPGSFRSCGGIGVLRGGVGGSDVLVASSSVDCAIHVHRVADGLRIASVSTSAPPRAVAVDSARATAYVSVGDAVVAYAWDAAKERLEKHGALGSAGVGGGAARILAFMPPASLVIGTLRSPELIVLSLPGGEIVQRRDCAGLEVEGLAVGVDVPAALAVRESGGAVHVLAWPFGSCIGGEGEGPPPEGEPE